MTNLDEVYKVNKNPWGSKPSSEIIQFESLLKQGTILDAGIGDGRNVLFLASKGFRVVGVDVSSEAIKSLNDKAQELSVADRVEGLVSDLADFEPTKKYDNILSSFTLHFLSKEDFPRVVEKLQNHTEVGGLNLITDFTQDGPLYKATTSKHWLKSNELKELYEGWEIVHYEEKPVLTRARDESGKQYKQVAATIVARKR